MGLDIKVKICGLSDPEHVAVAADAGAAYIGFVFVEKSPRYVTLEQAAALALDVPPGVAKVALTLDADNATLDQITQTVPLDMLQLHGSETPERVAEVRARYGLPVIKAVGIADASDLPALLDYGRVADQLLVDTKPSAKDDLPGGNGVPFNWNLLTGLRWPVPWMLAGGLTADNVAEAIRVTGTKQVDLSSAVESAPGVKESGLIRDFMKAALA
ncbi:MAG: phosphoribosylanthranilate isomerase [Marinosulfonomonas sp.]